MDSNRNRPNHTASRRPALQTANTRRPRQTTGRNTGQGNTPRQQPMPNQSSPNMQQPMPNQLPPNMQQPMPNQSPPNMQQPMPNQSPPNMQQPMPNQPPPNMQQPMPNQPPPNMQQPMPNQPPPNMQQPMPNQPPPNMNPTQNMAPFPQAPGPNQNQAPPPRPQQRSLFGPRQNNNPPPPPRRQPMPQPIHGGPIPQPHQQQQYQQQPPPQHQQQRPPHPPPVNRLPHQRQDGSGFNLDKMKSLFEIFNMFQGMKGMQGNRQNSGSSFNRDGEGNAGSNSGGGGLDFSQLGSMMSLFSGLNNGGSSSGPTYNEPTIETTSLDDYITTQELRVLKSAIPYFEPGISKNMGILVKLMELKNTFDYFGNDDNELTRSNNFQQDPDWKKKMLYSMRPHCSKDRQCLIDFAMKSLDMRDLASNFHNFQQGDDLSPGPPPSYEGQSAPPSGQKDLTNSLMGMLNPQQQQLFSTLSNMVKK